MILKSFISTFLLTTLILVTPAFSKVFNAEEFSLKNGLRVIVIPNSRAPVVTSMIWYKVGAADEPQGLSGMAHYFEHLMFKGTKKLEPGEFSRTVKKLGGNDNAFTGQDFTAYFQTIHVDYLDTVLSMEADRMVNLSVPKEHFVSEKKVVIEERRQRTENDPKGLFREQLRSALFVNHPYGTPVIGWMDEIEGYEWDDVKTFYDKWYAPNNAVIVISGDVTTESVRPIVEKHFKKLKPKENISRLRPNVPKAIGNTEMVLEHTSIHQPSFLETYIAPSFNQNKDDALALQVLEQILSGGPTTRLYKALVVEKKKATSVGISFSGTALDYGTITLYGTPQKGLEPKALIKDVHQEIANLRENGVTDKELADAKQQLIDSAVFARDSLSGPAMTIGYGITTGSSLDDIENWPEMIQAITKENILGVAQKYLDPDTPWLRPAVTGYLYPKKVEAPKEVKEEKE